MSHATNALIRPVARAFGRNAVIGLIAFLTVVDLFAAQAILPSLATSYGVSPGAIGPAVNASTFGMAISSLAVAALAHRLDRRRGVVASLVLLAVPTTLLAFAPDIASFAALRVAQGLCMASAFALTLAWLGEQYSAEDAAGAFAAYVTGNVASNLLGRLMAATVADHLGLPASFLALAALNLVGAALVFATLRGDMVAPGAGGTAISLAPFRKHLGDPRLRAAFGIGFCILFAFIGVFTYVNFVLVRPPIALGMMALGLVYLVFLPSIVTTPAAGRLVAYAGVKATLMFALAVALAGLPLLLLPRLVPVLFGLVQVGIGTFLAQAVATGYVSRAAAVDRGAASGVYLASYFSGGLAGGFALGLVFDAFGWVACVAGVAAALFLALGLATRIVEPRSSP